MRKLFKHLRMHYQNKYSYHIQLRMVETSTWILMLPMLQLELQKEFHYFHQEQDGIEKLLRFASRCLSPAERNYCTTRKELLAVVYFLDYFKH